MDGIINVYKEQDFTSFDVVAKLRGILHQRKIGHTGTLDPMAEGVLPVCLGNATKLCDILTDHDKVYEAVMILGCTYDTQDVTGNKLSESVVTVTENEITEAVRSFIGGYDQIPPMYSAKKVDGKKLYDLAREGKTVERKSSHVDIFDIDILSIELPRVSMRVHCGKGTYIRTLISDIGEKLSCGAAMEALIRTRVGDFDIEEAYTLSQIEEMVKSDNIDKHILCVDRVFSECRALVIPAELARFIDNGNVYKEESYKKLILNNHCNPIAGERFRMYDENGTFRAVYEYFENQNVLKPYKMFI